VVAVGCGVSVGSGCSGTVVSVAIGSSPCGMSVAVGAGSSLVGSAVLVWSFAAMARGVSVGSDALEEKMSSPPVAAIPTPAPITSARSTARTAGHRRGLFLVA
jgi:hypothetical protein